MTVTCPNDHSSATTDYCDQCGARIGGGSSGQPTAILPVVEEADTSPATRREPCPSCAAERSGDDRYCEGCGYDFAAPPIRWEALVGADRLQFERFGGADLSFPADVAEQRFALHAAAVRIGRSPGPSGESELEIDLAGATADPGVSRLHAVLERRDDGDYEVRDLGSTNGTTVNDESVGTDAGVALADGDRIRLGAWTTITVRGR